MKVTVSITENFKNVAKPLLKIYKLVTHNYTYDHLKTLLKMNNKEQLKEKEFDTVKFFRAVKEKIAAETKGMTFAEFKQYINNRKLKTAR